MKKILIISQYFTPDITAAAFRVRDLYDVIKESNRYEVDVITTYPHKSEIKETIDSEKNIYRIDINKSIKNKFANYLYQYFYFCFKAYRLSHQIKKKYDIVFVSSPPIFTLIPAYFISMKYKAKFIVDIRDIWPDSAVDSGIISEKSILYRITKKFEIYMYQKADIITCVSKLMRDYISGYTETNKIMVLYNGVNVADINNIKEEKEKDKFDYKKEKLNIFYAGNIGLVQDLDVLINAFDMDKSLKDMFDLHIIGDGALRQELLSDADNKNISIKYYGNLPKDETITFLYQKADILFLSLKKKESFKRTIPSKVFDYLLVNKPIIYGIEGEGKEILDKLMCGEHFEIEKEDSLIAGLNKMYNDYEGYINNCKSNFKYVTENFNRNKIFKDFIDRQF